MKTSCFRLPFLAIALVGGLFACEGEAFAANTTYQDYTWCGLGADNNWKTAGNWVGGVVPYDWNYAIIPAGDWTINIPENVKCAIMSLDLEDGAGTVTFTGSGTLSVIGFSGDASHRPSEFIIPAGRKVVIDGPNLSGFNKYDQRGEVRIKSGALALAGNKSAYSSKVISGDAKLFLEHGDFISAGSGQYASAYVYVSNRAEVVVQDGDFINRDGVSFYDDSRLVMVGGSYQAFKEYYTCYEMGGNSTCLCWGGMIRGMEGSGSAAFMQSREFMKMAPKKGGRIVFPGGKPDGCIDLSTAKGSFPFSGEVYLTNRTTTSSGAFRTAGYAGLTGGGTLYANFLNLNPGSNDGNSEWDLHALYLGAGGIGHNDHVGVNFHFRDGNLFGAFADWSFFNGPDRDFCFNLYGPLAFDTRNCFGETDGDGQVMNHTISGSHLKLEGTTDFAVRGGGTVELTPVNFPAQLRTLELADGATLRFPEAAAALKAMNLRMGAGSTIEIDLSRNSYVDVSATATIAADARIVVTAIPETLDEGHRYLVYAAPAKVGGYADADFPQIVLPAAVPAGWALGRTANSVYLTDGKECPATYAPDISGWTGSGADNKFRTAANWDKETAPADGACSAFNGTSNSLETVINVAMDQKVGNLRITTAAVGPFVFTNACLRFAFPNTGYSWAKIYYSVWNEGTFPMIVENDVGAYSADNSLGLQFQAREQGSVVLLGDSLDTVPLQFGGDVRLGGNYTATRVVCNPNYGAAYMKRRSSLTVLPGGRLTVTEQAGDLIAPVERDCEFYYAVATNGTMTVGGTDFTFVKPATHFVDGTLAVTCPLVTPVVQTFRGDGTLRLDDAHGNADDCLGGIRLEGNLTFVPGAWADRLTLFVKDNVTIAPAADWTYANSTNLVLDGHSKLTFATGGGDVTLAAPIVSDGEVAVTGKGRLTLGAAGTSLWKVTCADGAAVGATDELLAAATDEKGFADILRVRKPDDSLVFADDLKTKMRYEVETDSTVYSAKHKYGLMLLVR